ncbi:MAG: glycosyltransferase [Woeseiaceae bacterium]|nr:glycosyltransferase [Woeseiaceae bacterium]
MTNNVKKVLHIAPTPFFADRGCHIRIRGIALALEELGVDSLVCTYPIGRDVKGVQTKRTVGIPGYSKTASGPSAYKYLADVLLMFTVARQLWKYRPDILHCHLHEGLLIGWVAKLLVFRWRMPLVFDMQGSLTGELTAHGYFAGRSRFKKAFEFMERRIVALADFYFCSSEASEALLGGVFNVDPARVILVRDGVDVIDAAVATAIEPPPAGDDVATAIYTGGLTESKGIGALQEVLVEADRRNLPVKFVIVGYPNQDLQDYVIANGIQDRCVLTGQVPYEQLKQYLELADVALEPKSAGSGEASGKVVNYMAIGLPVVCFDTSNNREMLGPYGYFAESETPGAFVEQLELALSQPDDARERGLAGKERASARFSWRAGAEAIMNGYALAQSRGTTSRQDDRREKETG